MHSQLAIFEIEKRYAYGAAAYGVSLIEKMKISMNLFIECKRTLSSFASGVDFILEKLWFVFANIFCCVHFEDNYVLYAIVTNVSFPLHVWFYKKNP